MNCQSYQCRGCSLRIAREMLTFTSSEEPIGTEDEQDTLARKLFITISRREDSSFGEIRVGKFTD